MRNADENAKLNEQMWDLRAETYDSHFSFTFWTLKKLVSMLQLGRSSCLLDLACGTGWLVRYAARLCRGRGEFFGVDVSSKMIEKAQSSSAGYANVHFRKANVEQLPFSDDSFDFITCSNAFHHFSNPANVLGEAYRVLKPRGRIYILDATADDFVTKIFGRLAPKLEPAHVKLYSTREYRGLFEKAALRYVTSKPILFSVKVHIAEKSRAPV